MTALTARMDAAGHITVFAQEDYALEVTLADDDGVVLPELSGDWRFVILRGDGESAIEAWRGLGTIEADDGGAYVAFPPVTSAALTELRALGEPLRHQVLCEAGGVDTVISGRFSIRF